MTFDELVAALPQEGLKWHRETILRNSFRNAAFVEKTIRDIRPEGGRCLVISAGPSLYREGILRRLASCKEKPLLVATDGAYIQALKAGITPDWVITLDPHQTRMVRWFGDPDLEANSKDDDYFTRQDLDTSFRENAARTNAENISLVDANAAKSTFIIATTSPATVVNRLLAVKAPTAWFAPLVDTPIRGSLTRIMASATGCPALNTGGTVGTAAWAFAHQILKSPDIAIVGADFGYYADLPLGETQEWNMLKENENVDELFPFMDGHWGKCRTSPTYFYYLQNMLDLLKAADATITNCSGHGILQGARVHCMELEEWMTR